MYYATSIQGQITLNNAQKVPKVCATFYHFSFLRIILILVHCVFKFDKLQIVVKHSN